MEPQDTGAGSVLEVAHLCKSFAGLKAVDDVSFTVRTGEILGLIGPNGSGKTTLVNVITGLLPATSGTVYVDGQRVSGRKAHRVARAGIARTFQTIRLFHELTVRENVEVASVAMGRSRRKAVKVADALITGLGLEAYADTLGSEIPFGHQRKLEMARALAMEPRFVFLDEPAAGLNEEESDELHDLLKGMPARFDIGLIVIEHDMRLMMSLCPRLHVLNYGRTITEGTPAEVRTNEEVVTAYLGSSA
ncbi:MAG: ABC transporter ATP-binding protein [Coriobacteriia bacterium]|nr:ABC transporter ATP-binding protein [Coriobacteriia bacterium]